MLAKAALRYPVPVEIRLLEMARRELQEPEAPERAQTEPNVRLVSRPQCHKPNFLGTTRQRQPPR